MYYAKYKSEEVAVKVLHPDIKSRFLRDLTVLRSIVNSISWLFPQLRWLSIKESLEEFAKLMNIQVDLRNEAENLLKFHHNFKVIHFIGSFFLYSYGNFGARIERVFLFYMIFERKKNAHL